MPTTETLSTFDLVIVGGGMVGSMLAAALGHTQLRIAVLESLSPAPFNAEDPHDLRVSALSLASEKMLQAAGVWEGIINRRSCPYRRMRVWDGEEGGQTEFYSGDVGETHLGHIVENRVLQLALIDRLSTLPNVTWMCPATLKDLVVDDDLVTLTLSDQDNDAAQITTRLVVGADGASSKVRTLADIAIDHTRYPQEALVATVATSLPQQAITWQRFMPTGPQAFLPLSGSNASMVWYHNSDEISRLKELDETAFIREMMDTFPDELGRIEAVTARGSFPLSCSHARQYVAPRIALIGDAAHTVHPLAGQGVNLGLMDAAALAEVIVKTAAKQQDIGRYDKLRRYERWRRGENALMIKVLDAFYHAFKPQPAPLRQIRSLALTLADRITPIKHMVTRHAMGTEGDLPLLAKGQLP